MNAKVTLWWKNGNPPMTRTMDESQVERYLANVKETGTLKGYVVDATPEPPAKRRRDDIHPGDPVRVEHSLYYGMCIAEDGDRITVRFNDGTVQENVPRRMFVPMWTADTPKDQA
jgi:hypothetical protein